MIAESLKLLSKDKLYSITGNQFMELNTLYQLFALKKFNPTQLETAETLLLMPDLFNYFLTGRKITERSIASTTQLYDIKQKQWSKGIFEKLDIPSHFLTEIISGGTIIGKTLKSLNEEIGMEACSVIAVAGHDTQSALASVPTLEEDFAFISCGTWSLLGTEVKEPIISESAQLLNITNEAAFGNRISVLKNLTGLWIIQECKRQWAREDKEYGFSELTELSMNVPSFMSFIDPDHSAFLTSGNLPERIKDYCRTTNQKVPQSIGEIVKCVNQSLAMKYRYSLEELESCTGKKYSKLYMVGGGIQNQLLCQMTSNAIKRHVYSGPIEATALGNIAVQLISLGAIKDLREARRIIKDSQRENVYYPLDSEKWDIEYERFKKIIKEAKIERG